LLDLSKRPKGSSRPFLSVKGRSEQSASLIGSLITRRSSVCRPLASQTRSRSSLREPAGVALFWSLPESLDLPGSKANEHFLFGIECIYTNEYFSV
jgi:hypothetical protein